MLLISWFNVMCELASQTNRWQNLSGWNKKAVGNRHKSVVANGKKNLICWRYKKSSLYSKT